MHLNRSIINNDVVFDFTGENIVAETKQALAKHIQIDSQVRNLVLCFITM